MNTQLSKQRPFRADINGLRAIAVIAVVLYHFDVPGFGGGFAGVDVFFVISGYLMTQIIFPSVYEDRFSLVQFYLARARRIIPALAAVCLTVLVAGWFTLLADDYKTLGKHVASALLFVSNVVFARESGYFDAAPFDKWLLHTWSLSVEWQFYMVYPIAALLLRRHLSKRATGFLVVAICLGSFALAVYATAQWPTRAFYLLPTRAWEMLAGAIVYLYPFTLAPRKLKMLEVGGILGILLACSQLSHLDAWPGYLAIIPVGGAMAVLWAQQCASLLTSNPLSAFLGKISYSVYLWHWPIVVAINYLGHAKKFTWVAAGIAASIICGLASYLFIESATPRSINEKANGLWPRAGFLASPVALAVIASAIYMLGGVPGSVREVNVSERAQFIAKYRKLHESGLASAYRSECDFYEWETKHAKKHISPSCTTAGGPDSVFLWGDSHAQALSLGVRKTFGEARVSQVATSGCPPGLTGKTISRIENNCLGANTFALSEIARLRPGTVILAQRNLHTETDWDTIAETLRANGVKRVLVIGPAPAWNPELPVLIARKHWLDQSEFVDDGIHSATIRENAAMARKAQLSKNYEFVSMTDLLCPNGSACRAFLPGSRDLIALDYGHLSPLGSVFVVNQMLGSSNASVTHLAAGGETLSHTALP